MQDKEHFIEQFQQSFLNSTFVKLVLSKTKLKDSLVQNIYLRPVELNKQKVVQFLYRYKTKDETKNYTIDEALIFLDSELGMTWANADLFLVEKQLTLLSSKKGKFTLFSKVNTIPLKVTTEHNHIKKTNISSEGNIYLQEMGIVSSEGNVLKDAQKKFRQIHHYLEIIAPLMEDAKLPSKPFIVDFGSGKGYLTFALFDFLSKKEISPTITGVELRKEMVDFCNQLSQKMDWNSRLKFIQSDIRDFNPDRLDMLIALHACDTATDLAIAKGIASKSKLILTVPCCHKQVRKDWVAPQWLNPIFKNGIHQERQAELLTDTIRALLMEACGYQVSVTEFISTEHTPKNVMIAGVKKKSFDNKPLEQALHLMEQFGIKRHFLLDYLKAENLI